MSKRKLTRQVADFAETEMQIKRDGYGWRFTADLNEMVLPPLADDLIPPNFDAYLENVGNSYKAVLRTYRIFDWRGWQSRPQDLNPEAAACVDALDTIELLRVLFADSQTERYLLVLGGMSLGRAEERLFAQVAWADRNPAPKTQEAKKAKVTARRAALADYIKLEGERPEKRPGAWYAGFREAYPQHSVTDKTLKADYPHALALVRKQKKTGSNKRS